MVKRPLYCSFVSVFSDYKSHEVDKMSHSVEYVLVNRRQLLCWVALSCSPFWLRNGSGCAVEVHCDLAASAVQEQILPHWWCRLWRTGGWRVWVTPYRWGPWYPLSGWCSDSWESLWGGYLKGVVVFRTRTCQLGGGWESNWGQEGIFQRAEGTSCSL